MTDANTREDSKKNYKPGRNKKHVSRCLLIQVLYGWSLHPGPREEIVESVLASNEEKYSKAYFSGLIEGLFKEIAKIDEIIAAAADRPLKDLSPIEFSVLRLAIYEWQHCPEVPTKVVLNEALELTKEFGVQDGHKYVNAILDKLQHELRPD